MPASRQPPKSLPVARSAGVRPAPARSPRPLSPSVHVRALVLLCLALLLLTACDPASARQPRAQTACTVANCVAGPGVADVQLFIEPEAGEAPILRAVAGATASLWVEVYLLTDHNVIQALEEAANRGVDVRILLESHPFGGDPTAPRRTLDTLAAAGIHAKAANPGFTYTHEKAMIVDGATLYVLTCNLTKSALGGSSAATNREYAVIDTQADDVREARAIFQADWDRTTPALGDANLVVSPVNARAKLLALLASATSSLQIEQEEMEEPRVEDALIAAAGRGVAVQVVLPAPSPSAPDSAPDVRRLLDGGVHVRYSDVLYMHAKLIVADGIRAFVGSQNFSATSLDQNRELGILVADPAALVTLRRTFAGDWGGARAA